MTYDLPTSLEVCGTSYEIRSDYRAILDIMVALSDPELDDQSKAYVALTILYPGFDDMPREHYEEALKQCFWFINGGEDEPSGPKQPKLVDWEQDFPLIVAAINKNSSFVDVRSLNYYHWWSWLSDYKEKVENCTFAQVVSIRDKLARHKKLEKHEQEWYRRNRHLVDFKRKYTQADDDLLKQWI